MMLMVCSIMKRIIFEKLEESHTHLKSTGAQAKSKPKAKRNEGNEAT